MKSVTIGKASKITGLSQKMIRYYEQQGLLKTMTRTESGYRIYNEHDLHSLRFIRSARELGFSLKQIASLTDLWQDRNRSSSEVKKLALDHINELEGKARTLQQMADTLKQLATKCHGDDRPECPILNAIEHAKGDINP